MNSQFESKADGPQQAPSRTIKSSFNSHSDYLLESRETKNSTRIWIKSLKQTDLRVNPLWLRRWNPTRNQLLLPLQKENYSPQIRGRRDNSQNTKNYRSNKAFRLKKTTTSQRFPITIAEFSWPYPRNLQIKRSILWH